MDKLSSFGDQVFQIRPSVISFVLSSICVSEVSFEDLDRAIEELFYKSDEGLFQCRECEHVSKQKPNIVNHVEESLI